MLFLSVLNEVAVAQRPIVHISGGYRIGESITVRCTTYHSCPYKPPSLSLTGIEKNFGTEDKLVDKYTGGGKYEITLTRIGVVQFETQNIQCFIRHSGGLSASTTKQHKAVCK